MDKTTGQSIAFVLGGLNYGGAERVASHLLNYWVKAGWDVTLICRRGPSNDFYPIPKELKRIDLGGEGPSTNKVLALFKNIPFVWRLRQAIKHSGAPVVLSFLTKTNIHTILACIGLNKKVIISERNDTTRQEYPWPWPALRKVLYRYADVVTANSTIALNGMKGYVPAEKLAIVPNPVFIQEKKATPDGSQIILNVGRMVPQKNQKLIIQALDKLEENRIENWTFEILGDGAEENKLRNLANTLGLEKQVILHGLVNNTSRYYKEAAIFVLSSVYEGTPNALLEAMSYGLPSIVSDSLPGALEIIEDHKNGLIFSSGDADDLADKIKTLINKPELRSQMGAQAAKDVEKYSPNNVIPIWNNLIKS